MKIVIEIGTEAQKELIANELNVVKVFCENMPDPPSICEIWVPENFDQKVNELQGSNDYISNRGDNIAVAKNIYIGNETALVFSRELFTDIHDNQTRMQMILHEFYHTINRKVFPELPKGSPATHDYLQILYLLFDEYWANRKSFEVTAEIYPNPSSRHKKLTHFSVISHLRGISNSEDDYEYIKIEIQKFRTHGDVTLFLQNTRDKFDMFSKSLIYFFSYIHHYRIYSRLLRFLSTVKLITESALSLGDYFKRKYEQNEVNIFGGLVFLQEFMENFGVRFEDREEGLSCNILDI